ncbi:carbohydrate kinase family protein [Zongyangia hominis]|uniref:Carbohydrate kinase family protein n=1 Tax=Zongyangia hominis TaxID=2763677 RepID=A0A926EET2_9FIRM|nr:carbohydrate kinase family protein [Zongyangia hominis]MBC8570402.1 carbohydrate kinase family protein [Zongyangia hominis]
MDIVTVGHAVADIVLKPIPDDFFQIDAVNIPSIATVTGGDALNTAIDCARLGMQVGYVAKTGTDANGDFVRREVAKEGVDISRVVTTDKAGTACSVHFLKEDGERHTVVLTGANAELNYEDLDLDYFKQAKVVQYGSANGLEKLDGDGITRLFKACKEAGCITSMDVTCDLPPEVCYNNVKDVLHYTDIFFPSDYEAEILTGGLTKCEDIEEFFRPFGIKILVIKLGARGVYVTDFTKRRYISTFNVPKVVDVTGCGDSFVAAFLTGIVKGWSMEECAVLGNAVGSMNCQVLGANLGVRTFDETMDYIRERIDEVPEDLRARFQ